MLRSVCVPVALMSCLVLLLPADIGACPRSCNCYQASEVHCTFRALLTVPSGLPLHTRRINLGFNSITAIHNKSLSGLKRLELLMLHSNALHYLPDAVFADLKSLQILKLSYNKLREIPSSLTFSGLTSLLRLYLDHNLLQHIHPRALLQLPSLRLLRLQGNRLHQLHPQTLCTLSLLNTYYFSTLRHLDLSNNSLTVLPRRTVATAPLLETLTLHDNPWSCDCRMNWFLTWTLAHPGLMKCPGGPQCPVCASPNSLKSQGLLEQTDLTCFSPVIPSVGRETPLEAEISEIDSSESFIEPLGSASLDLSDHQGNNVDLRCNVTQSSEIQDSSPPDLSLASPTPLPLALSLTLDCPVDRQGYEKLWRILAYYSETAVRLEREILLSKAPSLAYRYRQAAETDGYYHSGVRASVKARPQWLLQPAISIQLNRAHSNGHKVQLIYSTRVSARLDFTSSSTSSPTSQPWVLISTNSTTTAFAAAAGHNVELPCPLLSSGNPKVHWILPDGSQHFSTYKTSNSRLQILSSSLVLHKVQLSDAGIYYCVARAGRDVDILPLRLTIEESSVPPSGEPIGLSVSSAVGEPVILSCRASGSPEPQTSWLLPDGKIIHQGVVSSGGVTVHPNGSLLLPNPSRRDAGYYRCIAVSQYGSDALSTQLELISKRPSLLRMPFQRGPQSAAGRSTKIRAPLLHEMGEGSGDEEEQEDQILFGKRRQQKPPPFPNRRYPAGNPRRRGPMRGTRRRGPLSSADQRKNHLQNRFRVTTNKQRIDPQRWADLLAKIRQKTEHTDNNQTNRAENPTTEEVTDNSGNAHNDTERDGGAEAMVELETEGSAADVTDLQEEGLQPIYPVFTETKTPSKGKTDAGTDLEIKNVVVMSTASPTDIENSGETHIQTENVGLQTEIARNPDSRKEVTSQTIPTANTIIHEPNEQKSDPTIRPHKTQQRLLPNVVPNSRPQGPWNSRRRIGQRRRIIHRPRLRPLTSPQPSLSNPKSLTEKSEPPTEQTDRLLLLSTTSSPTSLVTQKIHSGKVVKQNSFIPPFSYIVTASTSTSDWPLVTSPSSLTIVSPTDVDRVTLPTKIPEPTDFTQAPSRFDNTITVTDVSDTSAKIHKHRIETDTESQTVSGTHREKLEGNSLNTVFVLHSSTSSSTTSSSIISSTVPTSSATTAATEKITTSVRTQTTPLSSFSISDVLWTTTAAPVTSHPILSTVTGVKQVTYNTTRIPTTTVPTAATTTPSLSTTTVTSSTPATMTSAVATSRTFTPSTPTMTTSAVPTSHNFTPSTPTTTTTAATAAPTSHTFTPSTPTTTTTATAASSSHTIISMTAPDPTSVPTPIRSESDAFTTSKTSRSTSVTTTMAAETSAPSTTITTPIKTSSGRIKGGRPVPGISNQGRFSTGWKNPGANFIPDSHSSRPRWPPSPPLPAAPGAPVLRSRPKIAEPHVRTASFPAGSTARLVCESEGEPKPFITWTKVTTGAVVSIHSRAQRFEVLPNGTLVINDAQLQDRGTYICSAQSFLGRDRSITTLDVWTRPPRMLVPSYRETTIHQGGELHLECRAEGVPTPLHSWVLPDRSVLTSTASSNNRITMDTNATLHILAILPSDRGLYRCVASNSAGAASATVHIYVSSLPPVMQLPREEHLLLSPGMPIYAHCSARGAPPPTLSWRIPNGTLVRPSQFLHDNLFVLPNGTLHIRKVGPKDFGNYECTATNAVGADKRTVRVKIEGLAESEIRQGSATVDKSSSSSSFLHNERNLSSSSRSSNPISSKRLSSLLPIVGTPGSPRTFSYPPQHNSTDSFAIVSKTVTVSPMHLSNISPINNTSNSLNKANKTKSVLFIQSNKRKASTVLHPLPVSPFTKARIVSTSPSLTTVHYGRDLQLQCSVTGNPPPIVIWRTPSKKLVDIHFSFDQRLKVHSDGTLSVQAVTEKDAGDYLCITRNKVADDYRLLRVSVATKPAKIEPRQPFNHMVSLGNTLKVDCQASGLPDPAVHWKLPDGTMVNSVLQAEEQGGRARRLTVFDNGTLLVPAVGAREEGEYTCYAENQGGQDTMKVKVKVMMATPPTFGNDRSFYIVKVPQGKTAAIRCQAKGDPIPIITWFSPAQRSIPQQSRFYHQRVAVLLDGTLEVHRAQKIDTGNYTCRASNSAGETNMVVGLEVEDPNYGLSDQVGGRGWSPNVVPNIVYSSISRGSTNNGGISRDGIGHGVTGEAGSSNNDRTDNSGRIRNNLPTTSIYTANSGFNPTFRNTGQNRFSPSGSGITFQLAGTVNNIGFGRNTAVENQAGISPNGPGMLSSRTQNSETISGINSVRKFSSTLSNHSGARASGVVNDYHRKTSTTTGTIQNKPHFQNSTNSTVGVVTLKKQAIKGQTLLFPCPSIGSPPPRLAWLLPSNGVLPAPYYGSRFTVYRNGSLELRSVRVSDTGTLTCVVRGTRDETKIQVELEVFESPEEVESPQTRTGGRPLPERPSLSQSPQSTLRIVSPEMLRSKALITQKPLTRGSSAAPFTLAPPPRSTVPLSEPVVKSRTVPLVRITNGETLHLSCPVSQIRDHTQGSLSWTLPNGNILSLGESGDSGRYQVEEDGTLTVRHTTVFDRGTYTCKSTSYDSSSASAFTVPVIIIAYPPRITMGPSPLTYTHTGVTVELPCLTIATPRATITWETPDLTRMRIMGQTHLYGNRYLNPQGSLVIQNPTSRDSGVYKCTASNVIGVDTKVTYLHVL